MKPVQIREKSGGKYILDAQVMFKDSLFKVDINVTLEGDIVLSDEELMIEDMPVLDDTFGL